mgnify:CR=1 FL=1
MCPRFAVIGEGPLGILNDQDSLLATTAGCQWCSTTGSPSNRPHSVHGPSKSRAQGSISYTSLFFEALYFYRPPEGQTSHGLKPRSSIGRWTLLARCDAETSYRAPTGWAARGQGVILSYDGRRWRLCFGIERMLTFRRDGVMV